MLHYSYIIENDSVLRNTHEFYEMTREEQIIVMQKKARRIAELKMLDDTWASNVEAIPNGLIGFVTFFQ